MSDTQEAATNIKQLEDDSELIGKIVREIPRLKVAEEALRKYDEEHYIKTPWETVKMSTK
jgi:hypothetical protein